MLLYFVSEIFPMFFPMFAPMFLPKLQPNFRSEFSAQITLVYHPHRSAEVARGMRPSSHDDSYFGFWLGTVTAMTKTAIGRH